MGSKDEKQVGGTGFNIKYFQQDIEYKDINWKCNGKAYINGIF
jgi:hypothetical protein